jgi:hypothetical protein
MYAIYIITNTVNAKQYVGITSNLTQRWSKHRKAAGDCPALHAAIKKYGHKNFAFTHIADAFDLECACKLEMLLIAEHNTKLPSGYNMTDGGEGSFNPSDETRAKYSLARKGKAKTAEHKAKIAAGNLGKSRGLGKPKSVEHNLKVSNALMGNKNSVGRKDSAETIAKRKATRAINKAKKMKELV